MDETKELLSAILHRLDSLDAKVDGMQEQIIGTRKELNEFREETNERFDKVDGILEYLGEKWMEHDMEIRKLKKKA